MPHVTISFQTDHPQAMVSDWTRELGLLDPKVHRRLRIVGEVQVDVGGRLVSEASDSNHDTPESEGLLAACELAKALYDGTPWWRLFRRQATQNVWLGLVALLEATEIARVRGSDGSPT